MRLKSLVILAALIKQKSIAEMAKLVDLPIVGRCAGLDIMFTVYAIKSKIRKYIYVGMTENLTERIRRHNRGYEKTTKPYIPFELIYEESHSTRKKAKEREKYFKSGIGKDFLKQL